MKIKYFIIFILGFIFISDVYADSVFDRNNSKYASNAYFYNCVSNDNCNRVDVSRDDYFFRSASKLQTIPNSSGVALAFPVEGGLIKDNIYTISIYINVYASATINTTNNMKVGVGDGNYFDKADLLQSYETNGLTIKASTNEAYEPNAHMLTYTFKANSSGNYVFLTYTTSTTIMDYNGFYGYNMIVHGQDVPSVEDIQSALDNNFVNLEQVIIDKFDLNFTNFKQSIREDLLQLEYSMGEKQDQTNSALDDLNNSINSDSDDVTSGSCGIICKLKGIFTGIINMPSNIWNVIKGGFEWIVNSIGDLVSSITDIFVPKKECKTSPNLFHFDLPIHRLTNLSDNMKYSINDDVLSMRSINARQGIMAFTLGKVSDFKGKWIYLSAEVTSGISYKIIYYRQGSPAHDSRPYTTGQYEEYVSGEVLGVTLPDTADVLIAFKVNGNSSGEVSKVNVTLDKPYNYEPFGETCTGSDSFLGFIGDWFKSIVNGILSLPKVLIELLIDCLKLLFVPTDSQLYEIIEDSSSLSENFGFVGEAINFFLNIFTSLLGLVNANGCIELPEFTIGETSLFDSHTFWEARQVCLNENPILNNNIDTIRTITSIALVSLFINFAAIKFHSILSKNDYDQARTDAYDIK